MSATRRRAYVWIPLSLVGATVLWILFQLAMVVLLNADLYGRLTETLTVGELSSAGDSAKLPIIRLTLHRLLSGENAVEASLVVVLPDSDLEASVRRGEMSLTAMLRDRTTVESVQLSNVLKIDQTAAESGFTSLAARSGRFPIPFIPSALGFPFDDVRLMPMINLRRPDRFDSTFKLEVQKALPGRLLKVSKDVLNPEITLTRTSTEKSFVLVGGLVFVGLSIVIFITLVKSTVLKRFEELLAVAGYLVAATGFRDLLGISREAGVGAFEVIVFGLPILLISIGIGLSVVRGAQSKPEIG